MSHTRRDVLRLTATGALAAAGIPVLSACGIDSQPTLSVPANADEVIAQSQAYDELLLVRHYAQTIEVHPLLGELLEPFRQAHESHARACADVSPDTLPAAGVVPTDPVAAVAELISLERGAARTRAKACEAVTSPDLVRALALISGSEAQHAQALIESGAGGG